MIPGISLMTCVAIGVMVAALCPTSAEAVPITLTEISNQVTPWTGTGGLDSTATIVGQDGNVVNGAYEGAGMAITETSGTAMYDNVGDAAVKINWNAEVIAASPVDQLFLNLNTWLWAEEEDLFLLGDTYHLSEFTYTIDELVLEPPPFGLCYAQVASGDVEFDTDGEALDTTYTIPTWPSFYLVGPPDFLIQAEFDVASAYDIEGPGAAESWAEGYVDFTLSADGPAPEPATIWLFGSGLLALIAAGRVFGGRCQKEHTD